MRPTGKTLEGLMTAYLAARYENKTTYIAVPKVDGMGESVVIVPAKKWEALQPPKSKILIKHDDFTPQE